MLNERHARRWSVTVQHRWMDTEPVVCIALGGWDSVGAGLIADGVVVRETLDPHETVDAALQAAAARGLAVDLETSYTYGDYSDPTGEGTGYTESELRELADKWWRVQPRCNECGEVSDLLWAVDFETDCEYCSEYCAESAYTRLYAEEVLV